ncbi:peptidoglycan-binding protein [Humibacillus xanthopallidus]|uniref:L,D-transpeptidase family protein n=1 Tax=Humibacillus xanthopallidus TaxID=412689 RepID=UPI00384D85AA
MIERHGRARRGIVIGGALALALTAAACSPDAGVTASPTKIVPSSQTPPPTTPASPSTTASPTGVPTTTAAPLTPEPEQPPTADPQPVVADPKPVTAKPSPTVKPAPPAVIILEQGDTGPKVRAFQSRLRQIGWFSGDVSDRYGTKTAAAVRGFQAKRGFPVTGQADERTYDKVIAMTRRPTADELANVKPKPPEPKADPKPAAFSWDVDKRCLTGRVMCISKSTKRLTWVVDGVPQYGFDVRFGSDELPTREGVFSVYLKKVDVISNLYHTPMPYSMFFSGGQAVHYSSNFARLGYTGASHGCVNVRNKPLLIQLYNEARIGDKVVVHW